MIDVILRPMTVADGAIRVRLETDPQMMRHLGGPRPAEDVLRAHRGAVREARHGRCWPRLVVVDDQPAGSVVIFESTHGDERINEVGWMIAPEWQGKGVATAALAELLRRARRARKFRVLHAFPAVSNVPSNRLCEKFGFELLGAEDFTWAGRRLRCNDWRRQLW